MAFSIQLILSYDGTSFLGWQKTRMGPSIEEELEKALTRIFGCPIQLEAASRTDKGVHARGQSVCFSLEKEFDLHRLLRSLNALLPHEISVRSAQAVPADFHPTLHAIGKEYRYFLCLEPAQLPIHRLYSWHFPYPLDVEKMEQAAAQLAGTHDFSSFSNERDNDAIRTLHSVNLSPIEGGRLCIAMRGDRFLYKMARNIVGTLVYIGCGKLPSGMIPSLFESRKRANGGITAPAHGLFLEEVFYDRISPL